MISRKFIMMAVAAIACFPWPAAASVIDSDGGSIVPLQKDPEGLQRLRVLNRYDLRILQANPKVALHDSTADFTRLFRDPRSLINMAMRLRALPQDVDVIAESGQVYEIAQGLVVRQELTYRIRQGRCADPTARAALEAAGAGCFVQRPVEESARAFAQPGNARFVADPARRAKAIDDFRSRSIEAERMVDDRVRTLRSLVASPESRKIYLDAVGPAEVQRIESLSDDQLKDEMINSGEAHIQQTLFIPLADVVQHSRFDSLPPGPPTGEPMSPRLKSQIEETVQQRAEEIDRLGTKTTKVDLPQYIYLTGFTLSDEWGWEVTFGFTVNWCLAAGLINPLAALSALSHADCTSSYWLEPHAGFGYGFGLRFPITTNLHYERRVHPDNSAEAKVKIGFVPIDGSPNDYASTGLPIGQIFDGQELVARVFANAGFDYKLPVIGTDGVKALPLNIDFTQLLPTPFYRGQFPPPKPGTATGPAHFVFGQVDLLGGVANVGVASAKLIPMVDVSLVSNGLNFTLSDHVGSPHDTLLQHSGETVIVGVESRSGHNSRFSLKDPTYTLSFLLTPGVDARASVDLVVWSKDWDLYLMFPEIAVQLPPNGVLFTCHSGTKCERDFYTPGDRDWAEIAAHSIEEKAGTLELNQGSTSSAISDEDKIKLARSVGPLSVGGTVSAQNANLRSGMFDTDFGVLTLSGDSGTYSYHDGRVTVTSRNGATMDGTWKESSGTHQCADGLYRGRFHFEFTETGFTGQFGYCDEPVNAGKWNGKRHEEVIH